MSAVDVTLTPIRSQKVAFSASSAQSTALLATNTNVRVYADQDCHIAVGANPTAVADGSCLFLPAGQTEYFRVPAGGDKIAVIRDSADGTLYISEMDR